MKTISPAQAQVLEALTKGWKFGFFGPNRVMQLYSGTQGITLRPQVTAALRRRGLIEAFGMTITPEGRAALADYEQKEDIAV